MYLISTAFIVIQSVCIQLFGDVLYFAGIYKTYPCFLSSACGTLRILLSCDKMIHGRTDFADKESGWFISQLSAVFWKELSWEDKIISL